MPPRWLKYYLSLPHFTTKTNLRCRSAHPKRTMGGVKGRTKSSIWFCCYCRLKKGSIPTEPWGDHQHARINTMGRSSTMESRKTPFSPSLGATKTHHCVLPRTRLKSDTAACKRAFHVRQKTKKKRSHTEERAKGCFFRDVRRHRHRYRHRQPGEGHLLLFT